MRKHLPKRNVAAADTDCLNGPAHQKEHAAEIKAARAKDRSLRAAK